MMDIKTIKKKAEKANNDIFTQWHPFSGDEVDFLLALVGEQKRELAEAKESEAEVREQYADFTYKKLYDETQAKVVELEGKLISGEHGNCERCGVDRDRYLRVLEEIAKEPCEYVDLSNPKKSHVCKVALKDERESWCGPCIATEALPKEPTDESE